MRIDSPILKNNHRVCTRKQILSSWNSRHGQLHGTIRRLVTTLHGVSDHIFEHTPLSRKHGVIDGWNGSTTHWETRRKSLFSKPMTGATTHDTRILQYVLGKSQASVQADANLVFVELACDRQGERAPGTEQRGTRGQQRHAVCRNPKRKVAEMRLHHAHVSVWPHVNSRAGHKAPF